MQKCDLNKVVWQSYFGMGVLLQICCIFSEHLLIRTPLEGCELNEVSSSQVSYKKLLWKSEVWKFLFNKVTDLRLTFLLKENSSTGVFCDFFRTVFLRAYKMEKLAKNGSTKSNCSCEFQRNYILQKTMTLHGIF